MLTEDGEGSGGWEQGLEEAGQFGGGNVALAMKVLQPYTRPWMCSFYLIISVRINVRELAIIQHALTWLLTSDKRSKNPEVLRVRELNVAK